MINQTSSLEFSHFPVMLNEILKISSPSNGGSFLDCTFGGGGYSKEILKFDNTNVLAIDRDEKILSIAKEIKKKFPERFKFYQKKFSELNDLSHDKVDVVIFDLGISSIQLNDLNRGFSFNSEKELNMAMGLNKFTAMEAVNNLGELDLKSIIKVLGDEKEASRIAKNIIKFRNEKKIIKTSELVKIIKKSKKKNFLNKIDPCTKTFQALRIFVNKEITELVNGLINATKKLKPGGKILAISFHSIEDRIIKYFFSNFSKNRSRPSRYFPEDTKNKLILFEEYKNKVFVPSKNELSKNSCSRSAKLRFAIRSKNKFEYPKEIFKKFKKYLELEEISV